MAIDFATETTLRALSPALSPLSTEVTQLALVSAITSASGGVGLAKETTAQSIDTNVQALLTDAELRATPVPVSVSSLPVPLSMSRSDTYTVAASGTAIDCTISPPKFFTIQLKGTGAAATAWDVLLEGSLDNSNFVQILQHNTVLGDGATVSSGANSSPMNYIRSRCVSATLGGASNIVATILGVQ